MDIIFIPIVCFVIVTIPLALGTMLLEWLEKTDSPFKGKSHDDYKKFNHWNN